MLTPFLFCFAFLEIQGKFIFVALFFLYVLPHLIILFSWGNEGTPPGLDAFECVLICTRDSIHARSIHCSHHDGHSGAPELEGAQGGTAWWIL